LELGHDNAVLEGDATVLVVLLAGVLVGVLVGVLFTIVVEVDVRIDALVVVLVTRMDVLVGVATLEEVGVAEATTEEEEEVAVKTPT